jgi:hypothetical protein
MRTYFFLGGFLVYGVLLAQTSTDQNLGARLSLTGQTIPPTYTFSWWGKAGSHYIVETSFDLLNPWVFISDFNPAGANAPLAINFTTDSARVFFRAYQFDPNDISGLPDIDTDGLPDKWEMYYFGNIDRDGAYDPDGDGLGARIAFDFGLNPTIRQDNDTQITRYSYTDNDELSKVTPITGIEFQYKPDTDGNLKP